MKIYKIGDFAKYLGLSTQHLKHYAKHGLLNPDVSENGYRYFSFRESARVLRVVQLRSMGFSLNDARDIMFSNGYGEILPHIEKQELALKKEIVFKTKVLQYMDELEDAFDKASQGFSAIVEDVYVYFHRNAHINRFIEDKNVVKITQYLNDYFPFVSNCAFLTPDAEDMNLDWGLCVEKADADELGMETADLERFAPQRALVYYYCLSAKLKEQRLTDIVELAVERAKTSGYSPKGELLCKFYLMSNYQAQNLLLFKLYIPIE